MLKEILEKQIKEFNIVEFKDEIIEMIENAINNFKPSNEIKKLYNEIESYGIDASLYDNIPEIKDWEDINEIIDNLEYWVKKVFEYGFKDWEEEDVPEIKDLFKRIQVNIPQLAYYICYLKLGKNTIKNLKEMLKLAEDL